MTIYADGNLQYRFIDPSVATSSQSRNEFYRSLIDRGLQPTNLTYTKNGEKSEKLLFPGVIISKGAREIAVPLLKGNRASQTEDMINHSGHNEPDTSQLAGFTNAILSQYELFRLDLRNRTRPVSGYDVLIIGKPTERFTEIE